MRSMPAEMARHRGTPLEALSFWNRAGGARTTLFKETSEVRQPMHFRVVGQAEGRTHVARSPQSAPQTRLLHPLPRAHVGQKRVSEPQPLGDTDSEGPGRVCIWLGVRSSLLQPDVRVSLALLTEGRADVWRGKNGAGVRQPFRGALDSSLIPLKAGSPTPPPLEAGPSPTAQMGTLRPSQRSDLSKVP